MSRLASMPLVITLAALVAVGCTFNVQAFDDRAVPRSESDTEPFDRLRVDLGTLGAPADGADVVVRGAERESAAADLVIGGLLGAGEDADAVARGIRVTWPTGGDPVREMLVAYDGPSIETVWIERVAIELPLHTELDLTGDAGDVDVAGLDGFIGVTTSSGSIRVRDAGQVLLQASSGSIDVTGAHGQLMTTSGSIAMALAGDVTARANSGSIHGSFGGGGDLETTSGSIDVDLVTALDRDSRLAAGSGSITLSVPAGSGFQLETTTGSGSVHIEAGGVSHHGPDFVGAVGGGGSFTVRMTTNSGSIHVIEHEGT